VLVLTPDNDIILANRSCAVITATAADISADVVVALKTEGAIAATSTATVTTTLLARTVRDTGTPAKVRVA